MMFWITVGFFVLAGYITLRMQPASPKAGLLRVLGYGLTFVIIVSILRTALPRYLVRSVPAFGENWAPVWDEVAGTGNVAVDRANEWLDLGIPALPETSITTLDVAEPVIEDVVGGDGGVPMSTRMPAEGNGVVAVPTATPDPVTAQKRALYARLTLAQSKNDRTTAATVITALFELDPLDGVAADAQLLLQAADARLQQYQMLSALPLTIRKDEPRQQLVLQTLQGGQYQVVDNGAWFANFACQEKATLVDETPGFTYGNRFTVPRCYLEPLDATGTGARISLR